MIHEEKCQPRGMKTATNPVILFLLGAGAYGPLPGSVTALTSGKQGRMLCWLVVPGLMRVEPSTFCPWDTCSWSPEWPCR